MRFVQIRPHAWIIIQKYFSTVSPSMPDQINVEQSRYYGKRKKFSNWGIRIRRFISDAGCNFRRRKVRKRVPLFLAETWARYAAPESNEIRFLLPNICSICSNFNELSRRWWTVALKIAFFFCSFFFLLSPLKIDTRCFMQVNFRSVILVGVLVRNNFGSNFPILLLFDSLMSSGRFLVEKLLTGGKKVIAR